MTSASYSMQRSELARSLGLGQQRGKAAAKDVAADETVSSASELKRARKKVAADKAAEAPKSAKRRKGAKATTTLATCLNGSAGTNCVRSFYSAASLITPGADGHKVGWCNDQHVRYMTGALSIWPFTIWQIREGIFDVARERLTLVNALEVVNVGY